MRFNKLDLNLLVALDALLSTRSVSRSAEKLFLSQPATSLALGRLRDYFADELLVQVGKTYVPTPLAQELVKPVRDVLLQIQTITRIQPSFDPASSSRRVTIESSDYVISVLLSEVVRRAETLAPLMQFDLRAISPQTPEHLDSGEVELLIAPEFATVPGHPFEPLFEDGFSCVLSRDHPLADGVMSVDQYFAAAHVGVEWGGGRRLTYDARLLSISRRERRQEVIAPNFTLVPELLSGTQRVATLPTRLARQMAQRHALCVVPCPVTIPRFVERLQWHKYQDRDPAILWIRSLLLEVAGGFASTELNKPASRTTRKKPSRR